MKRFVCALVLAALPALCADNPMVSGLVKHWQTSKQYAIAMAEKMPEDGYASKPNPAQMTFAEQLAHLAGANGFFISKLTGGKSPVEKPATLTKASVIKMLTDSYDYAIKSIDGMTPEQAHNTFEAEGMKMSGFELLMLADNHSALHLGQCIVYLRVKGIAPPEYKF